MFAFDALSPADLTRRRSAKWSRYPADVIPLWVADMDHPVAPCVADVLHHHGTEGDLGYASADDDRRYREALARWMQDEHGWPVPVDEIHVIVDVLQGMAAAIATLTRPGDGIILQTPAYPPMFAVITEAGRRLIPNPLGADDRLDLDHLAAVAPDAAAVLWCNPHNPTGRVFSADEQRRVARIAADHDLLLISDEIHADLVHPPHRHRPLATVDQTSHRTVTLTSASKTFAMPGLSCAAAIAPAALLDPVRALPKGLLGHPSVLGLRAGEAAWSDGRPWLDAVRAHIHANAEHAVDRLSAAGLKVRVPEATYLLWVDCRHLRWDEEPAERFLREARVACGVGPDFGPDAAGHVRLNVATARPVLDEALDRMLRVL